MADKFAGTVAVITGARTVSAVVERTQRRTSCNHFKIITSMLIAT